MVEFRTLAPYKYSHFIFTKFQEEKRFISTENFRNGFQLKISVVGSVMIVLNMKTVAYVYMFVPYSAVFIISSEGITVSSVICPDMVRPYMWSPPL